MSRPAGAPKTIAGGPTAAAASAAGRALPGHPAGGQDDDAVGQTLGLGQLVRGQDDADPLLLEPGHHGPDGQATLGIHPRGGLVEKGNLGAADQGQGQGEALLLSSREMAPRRGGHRPQSDQVEQVLGRDRIGVVVGEQVEHPAWAQHGIDAAPLEHHPDAPAEGPVLGTGVEPQDADGSGRRPAVALERFDRRGLAGPVRTQDDEDLSGLGHQVDPVDGGRWLVA